MKPRRTGTNSNVRESEPEAHCQKQGQHQDSSDLQELGQSPIQEDPVPQRQQSKANKRRRRRRRRPRENDKQEKTQQDSQHQGLGDTKIQGHPHDSKEDNLHESQRPAVISANARNMAEQSRRMISAVKTKAGNFSTTALNNTTQPINLPIVDGADINTINYEADIDSRNAIMRESDRSSQVIIEEDIIPLTRLHHVANGDVLYYAGKKVDIITDAIAEEFCRKVKKHTESLCWYTVPESLHVNLPGINIIVRHPKEQMISIFRRLLVCCDISKHRACIDDVLHVLNITLPEEYPLELLVHYLTCEDKGCNIPAAFMSHPDFIKGFQTWKKEKEFITTKSERSDITNNPIRSLKDSELIEQITTRSHENRKAIETTEVSRQIEICMGRLHLHMKRETTLQDFEIVPVGSSAEDTRSYVPDEFDYEIIIIKPNTCLCMRSKHFVCYACKNILEMICNALSTFHVNCSGEAKLYFGHNLNVSTKFFTLHFNWFGTCFKHLHISIDLVPVLKGEKRTLLTPIIVCNREDFALKEISIINDLPENVKNGYTLAKALRLYKIYEHRIINSRISDICDVVKSYRLKTCLLHIAGRSVTNHESLPGSAAEWAMKIYGKFVTDFIDGRIYTFFDNRILCQFARDREQVCEDDLYVPYIIGRAIQILSTETTVHVPIVCEEYLELVENCLDTKTKMHIDHLRQTLSDI